MLYKPKWSIAKKRLKNLVCESLYSRVDFHVINYRKAHDQLGRAVITVDGIEKLSMCTIVAEREEYYREREIRIQSSNLNYVDVAYNRGVQEQAHEQLKKEGIYGQHDFFFALETYFNSSMDDLLKSNNPLIKILCILDRRIGKRTLYKMENIISEENTLVQEFYKLHCNAENIRLSI
ncbi:hypothetical protein [Lysinibacillus sp. fls2-241-R2A-57]|uniref:SF0329 family protein n=1 Tax=Lysinibacillus sp. fls2-241-R2A-57 TaxID=3040292 RepID=UPI0025526366|nr:hypothetical protein [Lysinibacillus sp. fls2-241-R2A-57]